MRTYRASSLGYSLEALVAGHLGYAPVAPPEWIQEKFDEGNRLEPIVLDQMTQAGWTLWDEQKEIAMEVIPDRVSVVGHVDAFGAHEPFQTIPAIIEVKTMADKPWHDFTNNGWDSKSPLIEKYKWQASAYMLTVEMPHVLVAWNKKEEVCSFTYVREPFYSISDIANKLAQAEECIAAGIVPEGCKDFPCPYFYLHAPNESEVEKADDELEALLESWLTWDRAEKAAKKEKDAHRERILALTGDAAAAKVKGECGVTVETYWQDEKEYMVRQQGKWVTRVQGPRKG